MTPDQLAALHAECFVIPRPWSALEFSELLKSPGCFLLTRPSAFLLGRVIADQGELLTIAVAPAARRQGLGRALVTEFSEVAMSKGAHELYLEVTADNIPALSLYESLNWGREGRRRRYYGPDQDAIVMKLTARP